MTPTSTGPSRQDDTGHPAKLGKGLALVFTTLVVLVAGIAIGNAARKRADRWMHGYR